MILSIVLEILAYYTLFSISVGFTSWFTIYKPILNELKELNEEVYEQHNNFLTFLVTTGATGFLAPIMFLMVLRGPDKAFKEIYIKSLLDQYKD
jgi:hypothetical protein